MSLSEWAEPYRHEDMILVVPKKYDREILDHIVQDEDQDIPRDSVERWYFDESLTLWGFPVVRVDIDKIYLFEARLLNDV